MPGVPRDTTRRIGLLGGSFNPAHEGHLHVSRQALKKLGLDEVWWLVSPQNPLKTADGLEPLATRVGGHAGQGMTGVDQLASIRDERCRRRARCSCRS